jgi:hypothetical protein
MLVWAQIIKISILLYECYILITILTIVTTPVRCITVFRCNPTFTYILFSYELKCKYAYQNLEIYVFTHSRRMKLFENNGNIT